MSSSRSIMRKLTPYLTSRIRENHRLLRYSSSSSATLHETSSSSSSFSPDSQSPDSINLTPNFVRRMKELQATEGSGEEKVLRLGVETGGCSGFQYAFNLDSRVDPEDRVFEREGVKLVIDDISFDFVKGATVDYVEELIRSAFVVTENPSAVGGCSCKSSFMVKQ